LPAVPLFLPLAIASLILGSGRIYTGNLYVIGQTRVCRNINLITCFIFFLLAPLLIIYMSAQGLALAYGFAALFLSFIAFWCLRKLLPLTAPFAYLGKLALATACASVFLFMAVKRAGWMWFKLLCVGFAGLIYFLALLPLRFYREEDARVLEFAARRLRIRSLLSVAQFVRRYAS
jgi:peptidoglycan biosynthesis protein MviN/MurJ (putative lipid II flippase)